MKITAQVQTNKGIIVRKGVETRSINKNKTYEAKNIYKKLQKLSEVRLFTYTLEYFSVGAKIRLVYSGTCKSILTSTLMPVYQAKL